MHPSSTSRRWRILTKVLDPKPSPCRSIKSSDPGCAAWIAILACVVFSLFLFLFPLSLSLLLSLSLSLETLYVYIYIYIYTHDIFNRMGTYIIICARTYITHEADTHTDAC